MPLATKAQMPPSPRPSFPKPSPTGASAILKDPTATPPEPALLALGALGWVLADETHADRLLALTGVSPEELRARVEEPEVLAAVLDFVLQHEPDTLACADALGVPPSALVAAHASLSAPANPTDWGA